jgi:hypothetical protein
MSDRINVVLISAADLARSAACRIFGIGEIADAHGDAELASSAAASSTSYPCSWPFHEVIE